MGLCQAEMYSGRDEVSNSKVTDGKRNIGAPIGIGRYRKGRFDRAMTGI